MKKKVVILGSTGSIGKSTFSLFEKDRKSFDIVLLSTNKNLIELIKQAKKFRVKNLIIIDKKIFFFAKKKYKNFNFFNSFSCIKNIFKDNEIYYTMNSIVGIDGLYPTLEIIKKTKKIAIVNKEAIVCGWSLIKKELIKYKKIFIPIDSEHFSIFSLVKNIEISQVEKIYITASGGPFLKKKDNMSKNISIKNAVNHPNWKMGKKISVDSSTLMNKVFEVIEAKNIFDLSYDKISILTHPKSYMHAIVKFYTGIIKILIHEPDMKIPIFNSIYNHTKKLPMKSNLNINFLNNLELNFVDQKKFPLIKILDLLPKKNSLFETAIIFINDFFVNKFLNKKINYNQMIKFIYNSINSNEILKLRYKQVNNLDDIYNLKRHLMFKFNKISI